MKRDRIVRTIFCVVLVLCVCVCCVLLYVSATTKTVYVDSVYGADTNDGTGTKPYKTLDRAISSAGSSDTKIVLKSNITISGDYAEPEHTGNITITSSSGKTITFTNSTGAEFTTYRLNGPTTFESVSIKLSDYHIFAAQHNPIVFGSGVSVTNGSKYAFVVGGYQTPDSTVQTDLDSSIRIDSGSFYKICGFTRTKGEAGLTFTGTASITINGGSVSDIYGASLYNHYSGSAVITVNGGTITNIYAGGDVTRRLNGAAVVTLNGGKVTKIDINNVVGDATLNLVGACPSAVSVSYASDTIKTLAEKAGSVKSANYNALVCTDSIVSSLVSQFDVVTNNAVVYVGGDGTGDGSSADSPMSSFADAYGKIAAYGGTLYVVGETYADKAILDAAYSEPVSIVGYSSDSRLVLSDGYTLDLYSDTLIDKLTIVTDNAASVICHSDNMTIGSSLGCIGSISLYASDLEDADVVCNIAGGRFAQVIGSVASKAGNVIMNVTGAEIDSIIGAKYSADNVRIEIAAGSIGVLRASDEGELSDSTVKLADGSIGKLVASRTTGTTILSIARAEVDSFELSALSVSEESMLVLGRGASESEFSSVLSQFDLVKTENAVYVADGGEGDGISALTPAPDINTALAQLGGKGKIVISGNTSISGHLGIKTHSYPVTITSKDEDFDYTDRAAIDMNGNIVLGGETLFENIRFACPNTNAFIYANERALTIGENVDTALTNANTNYINISGGRVDNNGNGDGNITVESGNWGKFRGGSVKTGTVTDSKSDISVTINGGTFHGYFILGSRGRVQGDISLTVNDGVFMQGIYGVYEQDTAVYDRYFNYDIVININGGVFYADIAPARSKTTELHGSYTVNLAGGRFAGLTDLCGAQGYAGDMTSALFVSAGFDTGAQEKGNVSFTNFLRRNNADPWLFYHDGYYYYTATGATTISLIKAANIGDIKTASSKVILRPNDGGVNMWSPEIHYFSEAEAGAGNAGWYMFVGHDDGTTSNQRQYVAKCLDGDDLMGRWGNPITGEVNSLVKVSFPDSPDSNESAFCGGMSVLKAGGKTYLTFVSEVGRDTADFHQTINITEFTNPWTMKGTPTVICEPEYDWEAGGYGYSETLQTWYPKVVEGASAVYSDDGDVYLMYTGSGYWTIYYQLGYMKLTGTDPLQRSSWTKNPDSIFSLSEDINGCGHASYFKDHNGDYWACYHAYTGKDTSSKRFSFVERLYVSASGVSIGNGSGHPAPLSTVYTLSVNPMALKDKIHSFASVEYETLNIEISDADQLIALMNDPSLWSENIVLLRDIDLSEYTGDLLQAPIGNSSVAFTGNFDGGGYTIRGINITASGSVGLFGRIAENALVSRFTAYGAVSNSCSAANAESLDEEGNYYSTGGIVGSILGGTLRDVRSYVATSGKGNTGGVVGMISISDEAVAVVDSCRSYASVTNTCGNTGGLIGRIQAKGSAVRGVLVYNCENYTSVSSTSTDRCRVGGIVGYIRIETQLVEIEKCANYGDVSGNNTTTATNNIPHVGGIAGRCEITSGEDAALIIRECKNEGDIYTRVRGGGIVGIITRSATCTAQSGIYMCENRGEVCGVFASSTVQIGGIAGYVDNNYDSLNFVIVDCINYNAVSCTDGKCYVGGIIGGQDSTDLLRCVNYGAVSGHSTGYTGALCGFEVNDGKYSVTNCYALASTAQKLSGYSRSAYCTVSGSAFVSAQDVYNVTAYPALDFVDVWTMREQGVVLVCHAGAIDGDVDGDASLSNADITILVRYLGGWDIEYDIAVCDIDKNGIVNNRDAIALIRKVNKS